MQVADEATDADFARLEASASFNGKPQASTSFNGKPKATASFNGEPQASAFHCHVSAFGCYRVVP